MLLFNVNWVTRNAYECWQNRTALFCHLSCPKETVSVIPPVELVMSIFLSSHINSELSLWNSQWNSSIMKRCQDFWAKGYGKGIFTQCQSIQKPLKRRIMCFYSEIWWWPPKVIKFSTTRVDAQLMTRCLCPYAQSPPCLQRQYYHLGTTWSCILPKVTSLRTHLYPWKAYFCFEITSHYIALGSLELTDSSALVFWGNRNRNYRV